MYKNIHYKLTFIQFEVTQNIRHSITMSAEYCQHISTWLRINKKHQKTLLSRRLSEDTIYR